MFTCIWLIALVLRTVVGVPDTTQNSSAAARAHEPVIIIVD